MANILRMLCLKAKMKPVSSASTNIKIGQTPASTNPPLVFGNLRKDMSNSISETVFQKLLRCITN